MMSTNISKQKSKVMSILADETGGKSYKAHKYSLDNAERPSIDYDDEKTIHWKEKAETESYRTYIDLTDYARKLAKQGDQLLSYFLDGSRRVFKVDDVAYANDKNRSTIYPVVAGQIGVGCCHRVNRQMIPEKFKSEIVLAVPDMANTDGKSGFFPALTTKINDRCEELSRAGLKVSAILEYKTDIAKSRNDKNKFEDKATAKIQDRMIAREKELVAELVSERKLNQDNYLIKDGSLEYVPVDEIKKDQRKYKMFKNNYNWVIGASKNFNPEVCHDSNGKPNPGFIADLPLYNRTPVACFNNPMLGDFKFAVWYVRLRDKKHTRTPFDGILKLEKMLVTDDEIEYGMDSQLVDTLTAYIINERNPVCYGSDLRWANHIYPVYLTESFVKSKYISNESFLHLF